MQIAAPTTESRSPSRVVIVALSAVLLAVGIFAIASSTSSAQGPGIDTSESEMSSNAPPLPPWAIDKLQGKYDSRYCSYEESGDCIDYGNGIDYFTFEHRGQCGCSDTTGYCAGGDTLSQSTQTDTIIQCFELCRDTYNCGYFSYPTSSTFSGYFPTSQRGVNAKQCDLYLDSGGCPNPGAIFGSDFGTYSISYKMQRRTCADKQPPIKWKINNCVGQKAAGACTNTKFTSNPQGFCQKTCDQCGSLKYGAKQPACVDSAADVCAYWVASSNSNICSGVEYEVPYLGAPATAVNMSEFCCQSCQAYDKYVSGDELLGWQYQGYSSLAQCQFDYACIQDVSDDLCSYTMAQYAKYGYTSLTMQAAMLKYYNEYLPEYEAPGYAEHKAALIAPHEAPKYGKTVAQMAKTGKCY